MSKEKEQSNDRENQALEMARSALGVVKELPMSDAQKKKLISLIDQAKQLESAGQQHKALVFYNQAMALMRKIKAQEDTSKEANLKEFWDWNVGEKVLLENDDHVGPTGLAKFDTMKFSQDGENVFLDVSDLDGFWLAKNGKKVAETGYKSSCIAVSDDNKHFALAVFNTEDGDENFWEVLTDEGKWDYNQFSEPVDKLLFSHDGEKLAVFRRDEISKPDDPYYYIFENDEMKFREVYDKYRGRDIRIKDFTYSPDSQKSAVIFHIFDNAGEVDESIVFDGDKEWFLRAFTFKWPKYSPDGKKLAVVDREGQILVNEKHIKMVSGQKALSRPVFSPDCQKIAYAIKIGNYLRLAVNDSIIWPDLAFSDINNIVYSDDSKNIAAAIVDPITKNLRVVVNGLIADNNYYDQIHHLTFSPDGQKIMFVAKDDKDGKYYRIVRDVSEYAKIET